MNTLDMVSNMVVIGILVILLGLMVFLVARARAEARRVDTRTSTNGRRTYRRDFGATNIKSGMSADEAKEYWSQQQTHEDNSYEWGYKYDDRF